MAYEPLSLNMSMEGDLLLIVEIVAYKQYTTLKCSTHSSMLQRVFPSQLCRPNVISTTPRAGLLLVSC
jgi:hypothetical protein